MSNVQKVADDPRLSPGTKAFLAALNSSGIPPLETMTPAAAREVLASAQASVEVDLSGIEEMRRSISTGKYDLMLDVVRPAGARDGMPAFMFVHGGALIEVAESDILRDEGEAYGRRLAEAGVRVATVRYNGMIHDFGLLNGLGREPGTLAMIELAAARLRIALGPR